MGSKPGDLLKNFKLLKTPFQIGLIGGAREGKSERGKLAL
jgi:hypothetical protein